MLTISKESYIMPPKNLLSPLQIGPLEVKNRIVMAPMTRARAGEERLPNALMAEYYAQRASAGLIITEATVISEQANGWVQSPGIYTDAMVEGWKLVTEAVHEKGGVIFMQLWHCGRASHSAFRADRSLPVAPSAIAINGEYIHTPEGKKPYEVPRALETTEIAGIVNDYAVASERALEAGFDGVEIHSANGYLLDTFLESKTNLRTDEYGGSIENRHRFLGEVVDALLGIWPAKKVGVRISPNGMYNDMGSKDYREQFLYTARQLDQYGLGYLHVMDGLAFGFHQLGEPMTLRDFRQVFRGPIMGNCGYTVETAEAAIGSGAADLISFGRPFISTPDLVNRIANDWPLAPAAEVADWYSHDVKGYTDFSNYSV
jgi:N-ethylmaleimide reductase